MPSKLDDGIQQLLYTIIIHERLIGIDELAEASGCRPQTVYDYLERRPIIPIKLVKCVYEKTQDARVKAVLEPRGYCLEPEIGQREIHKSIERDVLDVFRAVSHLDEDIERSLSPESDGGEDLTPKEIMGIETLIDKVKHELADVQVHLNRARSKSKKHVAVCRSLATD